MVGPLRAGRHPRGALSDPGRALAKLSDLEITDQLHVLYAPGLTDLSHIGSVIRSVDRPVNVLVFPGLASVAALAQVGVARISVGGAFGQVALAALVKAGRELLDHGTYGFLDLAAEGRKQSALF
ncbi:MAG: isocitrate lyase/phosphoenolpyruvate mutase family protein [Pseudonocardiaceae bacterium]